MKSRASFFHKGIFKKTAGRFWPLWVGYAVIWIIIMPLSLIDVSGDYITFLYGTSVDISSYFYKAGTIIDIAQFGGVIMSALFCVIAAMVVWNYLYFTRPALAFSSMPLKRSELFGAQLLAGLIPLLLANIFIFGISVLACIPGGGLDVLMPYLLMWLAIVSILTVTFYGLATLCAHLVGGLFALPIVYGVVNFVAIGLNFLISAIFSLFVYGYSGDDFGWGVFLSPIIGCFAHVQKNYVRDTTNAYTIIDLKVTGWGYLLGFMAAGIICIIVAYLFYKKRKTESAGDVIAFKFLKPIFKYLMAVGCGLVFAVLVYLIVNNDWSGSYQFDGNIALLAFLMIIGAFIGYFAAEMLNRKTVKVWKGAWTGFFVCAGAAILFACVLKWDLFGFEKKLPEVSKVNAVSVTINGKNAYFEDTEDIEAVEKMCRELVDNKEVFADRYKVSKVGNMGVSDISVQYTMKDDSVRKRGYRVYYTDGNDEWMRSAQLIINDEDAVEARNAKLMEVNDQLIVEADFCMDMTVGEAAELEGCDSAWEYMYSCYYYADDFEALSEEQQTAVMKSLVRQYCSDYEYTWGKAAYETVQAEVFEDEIDVSEQALRNYKVSSFFNFDREMAAELYQAVVKDIETSRIGYVYPFDHEFIGEADEIYREPEQLTTIDFVVNSNEKGYNYTYTSVKTYQDAQNTADWINEHVSQGALGWQIR